MPRKTPSFKRLLSYINPHKTKNLLWVILGLCLLFYSLTYLTPRQVTFNYGGDTCQPQFTLLPGIHSTEDKAYDVSFKDAWNIGGVSVAATKTCFIPKKAPVKGSSIVGTAPWNSFFARTLYNLSVPAPPVANLSSLRAEVPVTKPLVIALSAADVVHAYVLQVGERRATCQPADAGLRCDIPALNLEQGKSYEFSLIKSFKNNSGDEIASSLFKTLRAIAVTDGSVKPNQTVYARPKSFSFTTDKPIDSATAVITMDGQPVELEQQIDNKSLTIKLKDELPREKAFELTISKLEANDGSSLVEPYKLAFTTSGGPKVVGVSVASSAVPQSAAIILTFDQALSKSKDIVPFIGLAGGQATVQKRSDTQVVVQLQTLPLCQPFSLVVKQGIPSEYELTAAKAWQFNARTICHVAVSYGASLRGRALTAYIFGSSGPATMYVGGIHGNEPSSTGLMRAWVNELEANPGRLAGKRIIVIPAINPDGLAAGSRTNARGVNLNRNFPTDNWTKSIKDTDGTHPSGGGEAPLSEPEAKALAAITSTYRPRLLLSFHAIGGLVIGDPGGYSAPYAARYASMVGYRDGTNSGTTNFDYNVTGAYEDWTYRNQGIPSMVIELSSYGSVYNAGHYSALWAMLN